MENAIGKIENRLTDLDGSIEILGHVFDNLWKCQDNGTMAMLRVAIDTLKGFQEEVHEVIASGVSSHPRKR